MVIKINICQMKNWHIRRTLAAKKFWVSCWLSEIICLYSLENWYSLVLKYRITLSNIKQVFTGPRFSRCQWQTAVRESFEEIGMIADEKTIVPGARIMRVNSNSAGATNFMHYYSTLPILIPSLKDLKAKFKKKISWLIKKLLYIFRYSYIQTRGNATYQGND